jgi:hypothetical protein
MKQLLVILSILIFQPFHPVYASQTYINTEDHPAGAVTIDEYIIDQPISHHELRNLQREEKRYQHLENKINKILAASNRGITA